MNGFPEWPRWYHRLIAGAHFAIDHPLYVGRFYAFATPWWWLAVVAFIHRDARWRGRARVLCGGKPWHPKFNRRWVV